MSILAFDFGTSANQHYAAINRNVARPRSDMGVPTPPSFLNNLGLSKTDRQAIWVALEPEARVATMLAGRAMEGPGHGGRGGYQPYLYPPTAPPLNDRTAFAVTAYMNFDGLQGAGAGAADPVRSPNYGYSWQSVIPLDIDLVPPSRGLNLAGHVAASYNERMAKQGGFDFYA